MAKRSVRRLDVANDPLPQRPRYVCPISKARGCLLELAHLGAAHRADFQVSRDDLTLIVVNRIERIRAEQPDYVIVVHEMN
jgi:hypothetical protein